MKLLLSEEEVEEIITKDITSRGYKVASIRSNPDAHNGYEITLEWEEKKPEKFFRDGFQKHEPRDIEKKYFIGNPFDKK